MKIYLFSFELVHLKHFNQVKTLVAHHFYDLVLFLVIDIFNNKYGFIKSETQ